ncbi:tetratricopeptide repeat protein [Neoroseomonas soli]|uniref:Tetratricopeptide repeat protein n=1 Tax=Neoroseomonas soli TaxID=1081025 RepID=A0A9X9WYM0_9PROT|nr:tetratricopeptide repeat protein [Neoroseomonas soli]MBR0672249.1 tetratricopeptide repeat protein [Neoroseomonas soli]
MPQPDRPPARLLRQSGGIRLHVWPGEGPATLVVFAPGRIEAMAPDEWWGHGLAARLGWTTLSFSTDAQDWYPAEPMSELLPEAVAAGGPASVTYGFSMGGYAALKYARALGAKATLALSPQYSIDPADVPEDARSQQFFDNARHVGMAVRAEDLAPTAIMAFDPFDREDGAHAALLARLPGLHAAPLRHAGHATPTVLVESRSARHVLMAALAEDPALALATLREARRASPTLLSALALALEQRGHPRWAKAFGAAADGGRTVPPHRGLDARARALRRVGRYEEEEALLREWIAQRPEEPEPRLRLANCCIAMDDPARAAPAIREAIATGPVDQHLRGALVQCLKRLGRVAEAVTAAEEAVAAAPRLASAHAQLGSILAWARRPGAARRAFTRAIAIDPSDTEAATGLAILEPPPEGGTGHGPRMTELLARMSAAPAAEGAWHALANQLREARRVPDAIAVAELGLHAHPAALGLRRLLATLRLGAGQLAEAETGFRALTEAAPEELDGWLGLTDALWRQRRFADGHAAAAAGAIAHPTSAVLAARHATYLLLAGEGGAVAAEKEARRAIALDPGEENAYLTLADALWRQHRAKDALREIRAAAGTLQDSVAIAARLGHLLLSQDSPAAAAEAFARATVGPRVPAHVWLGYTDALWRAGRVEEAAQAARRGVAAHPKAADLRARLGQLLLAGGDAGAAREALAEALEASPSSEEVHLALADALWRQGRRAEAVSAAREAVAAVPDKPAVAARLGHLLLEDGAVEEAAAIFGKVTQDEPTLVAGWVGLSEAERLRKRIRPALDAYRRAVAEGADRPTQRMMRFRLFGELEE